MLKKMSWDKEKRKEYDRERYNKNKEKFKERARIRYIENTEEIKISNAARHEKNRDRNNASARQRYEKTLQHACDSIKVGKIIDQSKWIRLCNHIRNYNTKHPYSDNFTNDVIFELLLQKCFYCGDIATGIDRIDSKLNHTPENCVACCWGCNNSKGTADPATFIRKSYYRARGKHVDDIVDIWFIHKNKPRLYSYKRKSDKIGIPFELSDEEWDILVKGECEYCHRSPTTWFGIDRVIPEDGYVIGNVVSCCWDCNVDKFKSDVNTTVQRNMRIAERVDTGELVINDCQQVIIHQGYF